MTDHAAGWRALVDTPGPAAAVLTSGGLGFKFADAGDDPVQVQADRRLAEAVGR